MPPGGAPPAHAWGPTSPHGLLFCMSQSPIIRAGLPFSQALRPGRPGTAYVRSHKKMGAVRAGSHLRILTVIHSVTCGSLLSLDVSGVRGWHDWQVESRVGSSPLHRAEVLVAPEHKPDDSTPARYGGRASLVFYLIYLRKRNTTVLDAAHRAVFCCLATSSLPLSDATRPLN